MQAPDSPNARTRPDTCETVQEKGRYRRERRVLNILKSQGYEPAVIYDIGASTGVWSETISSVIPNAEYHLFEPLAHIVDFYQRDLDLRLARMPCTRLYPVALSDSTGSAEIFVTPDGYGSSLHDRGSNPDNGRMVMVPTSRLDDFVERHGLPPADVIKIDCQGYEDAILKGAGKALESTKVLFLETWLIRGYGVNTPLLGEVMDLLKARLFTLVELGESLSDERHRVYSVDTVFFAEPFLEHFCLPPDTWKE